MNQLRKELLESLFPRKVNTRKVKPIEEVRQEIERAVYTKVVLKPTCKQNCSDDQWRKL